MCFNTHVKQNTVRDSQMNKKELIEATDGCMGTERNRTLVISILLFIYCWFAFGAYINALNETDKIDNEFVSEVKASYILVLVGNSIILFGVILCGIMIVTGSMGAFKKAVGIIYFIGGATFLVGYCFIMDYYSRLSGESGPPPSQIVAIFAEAILPAFTCVFVGIDLLDLRKIGCLDLDREGVRLKWNFLSIAVSGVMLGGCYADAAAKADGDIVTAFVFVSLGWFLSFIWTMFYLIGKCKLTPIYNILKI